MCNHRAREVLCLAVFLTYQLALIYIWVLFLLSTNDIETVYCPNKITGRVFVVYPYNNTDE